MHAGISRPFALSLAMLGAALSSLSLSAAGQSIAVPSWVQITDGKGGFTVNLEIGDFFGSSVALLGDLGGDGTVEVAVGARGDDDGFFDAGAVYILSLDASSSVVATQKISALSGGFGGLLNTTAYFGSGVASLGDLDGDGIPDLAVGSKQGQDSTSAQTGAVWILFPNADGTVHGWKKISGGQGGFQGALDQFDEFGEDVTALGDLDGDGVCDLAVAAPGDDDKQLDLGAVWVLFLNADGSVKADQKISALQGGLSAPLVDFGSSVAGGVDVNGDGVNDLVVGAESDSDGFPGAGAVFVLFLTPAGTVADYEKISQTSGWSGAQLEACDQFGSSVAFLDDRNGDGLADLAVGAQFDDGTSTFATGGAWILLLRSDGTVQGDGLINADTPGLGDQFMLLDYTGCAVADMGDFDGDGMSEILLAAEQHKSMGESVGAVYLADVCVDPVPAFSASPLSGLDPLAVTFTDESTGSALSSWEWDFGDSGTSTEENPTHVYTQGGTFSVTLGVTGSVGSCRVTTTDLVMVGYTAKATKRNGSGIDADVFDPLGVPVIGTTWTTQVDGGSVGATGLVFVFAWQGMLAGLPTAFGELLVDPTTPFVTSSTGILIGGLTTHAFPVPNDLTLEGFSFTAQALLNNPGLLTNAIDAVVGF